MSGGRMRGEAASAAGAASTGVAPGRLPRRLLATDGDRTTLVLRLVLALVMFPHGAQKLLGWYGGYGFSGTMGFLTNQAGLPWIVALLVILIEFGGPLMLAFGLGVRVAATGYVAVMLGAIVTVHGRHGFFMNWYGAQAGEGFEYHLLMIGAALPLLLKGGGAWSLDGKLAARGA
jgi:putative oxidoreductase